MKFFNRIPTSKSTIATVGLTAFLGAVAAIGMPLTAKNEGMKLVPYFDSAHVLTWCIGETEKGFKKNFTDAECLDLFAERYGWFSLKAALFYNERAQQIVTVPMHAAMVDTGYNIGINGFRKSKMLRELNKGKAAEGCNAIMLYKYSNRKDCFAPENAKICGGIKDRRIKMNKLCLDGML